jgi:hypothetical protein
MLRKKLVKSGLKKLKVYELQFEADNLSINLIVVDDGVGGTFLIIDIVGPQYIYLSKSQDSLLLKETTFCLLTISCKFNCFT